jgi:hypothetical protein
MVFSLFLMKTDALALIEVEILLVPVPIAIGRHQEIVADSRC